MAHEMQLESRQRGTGLEFARKQQRFSSNGAKFYWPIRIERSIILYQLLTPGI